MNKIFSFEEQLPGNSTNNFLPEQIPVLQQMKTLLLRVVTLIYEQISFQARNLCNTIVSRNKYNNNQF